MCICGPIAVGSHAVPLSQRPVAQPVVFVHPVIPVRGVVPRATRASAVGGRVRLRLGQPRAGRVGKSHGGNQGRLSPQHPSRRRTEFLGLDGLGHLRSPTGRTRLDGVDAVTSMFTVPPSGRSAPPFVGPAPACHPISRSSHWASSSMAYHAAMLTIWSSTKAMGSSGSSSRNRVHTLVSSRSLIFTPRARGSMLQRCSGIVPGACPG